MGCQCGKTVEEENEISKKKLDEIGEGNEGPNVYEKIGQPLNEDGNLKSGNMGPNMDQNARFADYPDRIIELINRIREDPVSYADIVEDSIKNIIEENDKYDENKKKLIYKKKVKVALTRGEDAFHEAAEILRKTESLPPLEFKEELCIPLPESEEEFKDPNFLKEQVQSIRKNENIDIFFKDLVKLPEVSGLLMIVDDSGKNSGKKRNALLSKDLKYIGVSSRFIGKTFIAYFAFSQ